MSDDDADDEGDAYEEQIRFLIQKWGIPRREAERLLENKRHDE